MSDAHDQGVSADADRATAVEPVPVSPLRDGIADAIRCLCGGYGKIISQTSARWASITFSGARHFIRLTFDGAAAVGAGERFVADLPEHEFDFPRHLVADAAITNVTHKISPPHLMVECELLLLDNL